MATNTLPQQPWPWVDPDTGRPTQAFLQYMNKQVQQPTLSTQSGLAAVGTTQGSGPVINASMAFVATASAGNTSVSLPSATAGMQITVVNQTAQTLSIFPQTGESMTGTVNQAASINANAALTFLCGVNGAWWVK